jgi:hypothetical protein
VSVKIKRTDRRPELMRSLNTAAGKSLKKAALLCQAIARELVSRKFPKPTREQMDRKNAKAREKRARMRQETATSGTAET